MTGISPRRSSIGLASLAVLVLLGHATAQTPAQATKPEPPPDAPVPAPPVFPPPNLPQAPAQQPALQAQPQPAPAGAALPPSDVLVMLVRETLVAFNQANSTGNYGVLHALAAPAFQKEVDVGRLDQSFASFRERKIDVSAVTVLSPQFVKMEIDKAGILHLSGAFPSRPLQLQFNLAYQHIEGRWRYAALAVDVRQAPAQVNTPAATKSAAALPSGATQQLQPKQPVRVGPAKAKWKKVARSARSIYRTARLGHRAHGRWRRAEPPRTARW